jgi:hypothetical protein
MAKVLRYLTQSESNSLTNLIEALKVRSTNGFDTMKGGLTDRDGLVAWYASRIGFTVSWVTPFGAEPAMLLDGAIITGNTVNRIASAFNAAFGPAFFTDILENGSSHNIWLSIRNDILPALTAYQKSYDKSAPLRKKKAELAQVNAVLAVWDNPESDAIKKNIPCQTHQRWRTLQKTLRADVAELEAFN